MWSHWRFWMWGQSLRRDRPVIRTSWPMLLTLVICCFLYQSELFRRCLVPFVTMESRRNQEKGTQLWRSLVPDFCAIKHTAAFLLIYSKSQVSFITTPKKQRMIRVLNCICCRESGPFQVVLISSEKLHPVQFSLSLLFADLVDYTGKCFGLAKKKKKSFVHEKDLISVIPTHEGQASSNR